MDIKITSSCPKIFRKDTGHYTDYSTFVPCSHRISWIRSLVCRTKRICDKKLSKEGIRDIKKFSSWNGFPGNIRNRLVEKFVISSNATNATNACSLNCCVLVRQEKTSANSSKMKTQRFLYAKKKINTKTHFKTFISLSTNKR